MLVEVAVVVVMVMAVAVTVAVVIEEVVALLGSAFGFQRLLIRILQGRRTCYLFMNLGLCVDLCINKLF